MRIIINNLSDYRTGIHPEVTDIEVLVYGFDLGTFLAGNRFPNLEFLTAELIKMEGDLKLNIPFLKMLEVGSNMLKTLRVDCPSLTDMWCDNNLLTVLELNCPLLETLDCFGNELADLNGLEFCTELQELRCSESLKNSVQILKEHLPNLAVDHRQNYYVHRGNNDPA